MNLLTKAKDKDTERPGSGSNAKLRKQQKQMREEQGYQRKERGQATGNSRTHWETDTTKEKEAAMVLNNGERTQEGRKQEKLVQLRHKSNMISWPYLKINKWGRVFIFHKRAPMATE